MIICSVTDLCPEATRAPGRLESFLDVLQRPREEGGYDGAVWDVR
jgi:hypothetical protein